MQRFINPSQNKWETLCQRGSASYTSLEPLAKEVFDEVSRKGRSGLICLH